MTLPDHQQQSPDLELVIQRKLFQSDTQPNLNRLQIPLKQISFDDFLNEDEKNKINQKERIKSCQERKRKGLSISLPTPKRRRIAPTPSVQSYREETNNINLKSQIQNESCKGGVINGPDPPPPISEELSYIIRTMTLPDHQQQSPDLKFVIQRKLFQSDTQPNLNRLQMPLKQISSGDFLNEDKKNKINQKEGIKVQFIQPNLEVGPSQAFERPRAKLK
ncbi:hypothetical protein G4B88_002717 [Cannabis sativa]|uniref:Uncharacterized protein n=1 Tax=Cannabis sativa TaxID=3483 RepID=A0A7J6HK24_CANSA|nr:hypothetical protein G4B88_002717 [Cannabis sativa]